MARAGDVFHNPITGEHVTVLLGADDTDGRYLAATMDLPAEARCVGEHCHPTLVEAVEVLAGEITFRIDGEARVAGPGERVVLPKGVRHRWCNTGEQDARVRLEVWPARGFEQLMGTLIGLAREGLTDAQGTPDPLQRAVTARAFRAELRACSRWSWLQRPLLAVLAPIGRLFGKRPCYAHHATPVDRVAVEAWPERPAPGPGGSGEARPASGVACAA